MDCIFCGSGKISYDKVTDMYYCSDCHNLFTWRDKLMKDKSDKEELNGFSLTVLNLFQSIPIIGIIVPVIISKANVDTSYKRQFIYRFISQVFLYCVIAVLYSTHLCYKDYSYVSWNTKKIRDINVSFDSPYVINPLTSFTKSKSYKFTAEPWEYLDGTLMSGSTVRKIVELTYGNNLTYLVHNRNTLSGDVPVYKVYGVAVTEDNSLVAKQKSYNQVEDLHDLGVLQITDDRSMYRVDKEYTYTFNVILNDENKCIGFMFTDMNMED